jgi:hypothetical protein
MVQPLSIADLNEGRAKTQSQNLLLWNNLALPMPGEMFHETLLVVASCWMRDDIGHPLMAVLLVVDPDTPGQFYNVLDIEEIEGEWQIVSVVPFPNIVPAAQYYDDNYISWGGS